MRDRLAKELNAVKPVVLNSTQYQRRRNVQCAGTSCIVTLNLTNRLPVQVIERDYYIALLEAYDQNGSACRFGNVTSTLNDDVGGYRIRTEDCFGTSCTIRTDDNANTFQASVIVENGGVRISRATLRVPLQASLQIGIVC